MNWGRKEKIFSININNFHPCIHIMHISLSLSLSLSLYIYIYMLPTSNSFALVLQDYTLQFSNLLDTLYTKGNHTSKSKHRCSLMTICQTLLSVSMFGSWLIDERPRQSQLTTANSWDTLPPGSLAPKPNTGNSLSLHNIIKTLQHLLLSLGIYLPTISNPTPQEIINNVYLSCAD